MLKKTLFSALLAALTLLPTANNSLSAATVPDESKQIARVCFSFNIYGGCGGPCFCPCYNPYFCYPYPPCGYPCCPGPYWMW